MRKYFFTPTSTIRASAASSIGAIGQDIPKSPAIVHTADAACVEEPGPFLVALDGGAGHEEGFEFGSVREEGFEGFVDEFKLGKVRGWLDDDLC